MIDEIVMEVMALEDIEDATNKQVLLWVCKVEAQRAQYSAISIKEAKEFDAVRHNIQKCDNEAPRMQKVESCNYCGIYLHLQPFHP